MSPIDFFFFFWQYWGLNSWPCTCQAGTLPLEPLTQPPIASLSPSSTSSPDPGPSQSSLRLCPSPLCPPLFCLRIVIWPSAHQPTAPSPISSPKITDHLSGVGGGSGGRVPRSLLSLNFPPSDGRRGSNNQGDDLFPRPSALSRQSSRNGDWAAGCVSFPGLATSQVPPNLGNQPAELVMATALSLPPWAARR
jgi:hypothetical protein